VERGDLVVVPGRLAVESELTIVDLEPQDILAAWTRGDIDAAYSWLPSLDELKKTGKVLITSRELAAGGKPTLDLGVVSTAFATAHPEAVDAWRKAEAQALDIIASDPDAAAKAVGAELNLSATEARSQLSQGVDPGGRSPRGPGRGSVW
jgi:taurine transport system substrate-binding protein